MLLPIAQAITILSDYAIHFDYALGISVVLWIGFTLGIDRMRRRFSPKAGAIMSIAFGLLHAAFIPWSLRSFESGFSG